MSQLLPTIDKVVQLKVSGLTILQALENSVSAYPKKEGRFCAISGANMIWDASKQPGSRVVSVTMWKDNAQLDVNKEYIITCKDWIAVGKDGFICFNEKTM